MWVSPVAGGNDMKRRNILKLLIVFALWPTVVLGKKDCITSCDQCPHDYICCKTKKHITAEEWAFMDGHLREGAKVPLEEYRKGFGWTMGKGRCAFLTGRGHYKYHDLEDTTPNKCAIYENRPQSCKNHYCEELRCGLEKAGLL